MMAKARRNHEKVRKNANLFSRPCLLLSQSLTQQTLVKKIPSSSSILHTVIFNFLYETRLRGETLRSVKLVRIS
jgi:hypothetical protein